MSKSGNITHRVGCLLLASVILQLPVSFAQHVPEGVNYQKASPEVNRKAKAALQQALSDTNLPSGFLNGVINCGPMLWNDLKDQKELLAAGSTSVPIYLSLSQPIQAQGRAFRSQQQRDRFWKLLFAKFPDLRKGTVRQPKESEIQYYWATIPFNVEEPFFAIETPKNVFIVDLTMQYSTPVLFWIDRVGDLNKLKKKK